MSIIITGVEIIFRYDFVSLLLSRLLPESDKDKVWLFSCLNVVNYFLTLVI